MYPKSLVTHNNYPSIFSKNVGTKLVCLAPHINMLDPTILQCHGIFQYFKVFVCGLKWGTFPEFLNYFRSFLPTKTKKKKIKKWSFDYKSAKFDFVSHPSIPVPKKNEIVSLSAIPVFFIC